MRITADLLPWALVLSVALGISASAGDAANAGYTQPDLKALRASFLPAGACREVLPEAACAERVGPAVRYSLSAQSFFVGSAELPESLTSQLDMFAKALSGRSAASGKVRIEVHTDASGSFEANLQLSQRRADAVKTYLVRHGVDASVLKAVGMGSSQPKLSNDPFGAENRRVEIIRL